MEEEKKSLVRVSIFGHEYTVKAPADPEYIKKVAEYVSERMKEVEEGLASDQTTSRIAILAAMNIADELFANKNSSSEISVNFENRIQSLVEFIDESLV
ncbi:MAG: cell division protein ZapA [Candidatus Marinimicrobia bacterium]|nr:cell division protein ZapA [Candidatus Neomarinimicrobiota bacterium]|tara:strand:+ start:342 stop:638 length:297 start_codon:yes stop_codon:yes gene_type:complete